MTKNRTKVPGDDMRGRADRYLSSYALNARWLESCRYDRRRDGASGGEEVFLQAKMYAVRDLIAGLPDCREKLFLHCYYIRGRSMETTAELMDISRRTVYRLKTSALLLAAREMDRRGIGDARDEIGGGGDGDDGTHDYSLSPCNSGGRGA